MQSNHFALIIAASEYSDMRLKRLRSPAADAHELEEVLRDQQIGGYQISSLLNSPAYLANEAIDDFFQDRSRGDQLLLYFSCHGIKDDMGRLYFAASNTRLNRLASTGISSEFVAEQIYDCAARRIILILDCCYSGAFKRGLRPRANDSVDLDNLAGRGRAILFASNAMEYAFEIDGSEIEGTGTTSLFTRTVVHALRTGEADLDGDGVVSVDELYDYVSDQLRLIMPRQTPGKLIDTEGTIFIARSTKVASGLGALSKDIRTALSSPLAGVRKGIVEELEPLLNSTNEMEQSGARAALIQLSNDESDRVAAAAAGALGTKSRPEDLGVSEIKAAPDEKAGLRSADRIAPSHEGGTQPANHPLPAQGSGPTVMVDWIDKKTFSTTRRRPGYDEEEVDNFLDAVRDTFLGRREPPVTAYDVRNIQFSTTRNRPGYDEEEVDHFLDEVELAIESWATPVSDRGAQQPSGDHSESAFVKTAVVHKLTEVFGKLSIGSDEVFPSSRESAGGSVRADVTARMPGRKLVLFKVHYVGSSANVSSIIISLTESLVQTVRAVGGHGVLVLIVPDNSTPAQVEQWRSEAEKLASRYRSAPNAYVDKYSNFLAMSAKDFAKQAMPQRLEEL